MTIKTWIKTFLNLFSKNIFDTLSFLLQSKFLRIKEDFFGKIPRKSWQTVGNSTPQFPLVAEEEKRAPHFW